MKKKKNKMIWVILALCLIFAIMIYVYISSDKTVSASNTDTTGSTTTITTTTVGAQTITKTITGSGEISSNASEKLELNTYRYFKECYVEAGQSIKEGEALLKYTNGTYLYAPYDLVVTALSLPEEASICNSTHYIQVETLVDLVMTLNVDETKINDVSVGQSVVITPSAYEDKTYTGTISKINEIGTYASNGTNFKITITFQNDGNIKVGMSASCVITIQEAKDIIAVPIEAIQTMNSNKYVVVQNADGSTKNVTIETGISNDAYVEVKSGLSGGETIQMIKTTSTSSSSSKNRKTGTGESFGGEMPSMMGGESMMPGTNR